jgi:hypothetical protein
MPPTTHIVRNYLIIHDDWIRGSQRDVPVLALFEHEDENITIFRNVGNHLPDDRAQHHKILESKMSYLFGEALSPAVVAGTIQNYNMANISCKSR